MTVKGVLEVRLIDARGLQSGDILKRMDPYVILRFRGEERKSRVLRGGGSNPTWNEEFAFNAEYPSSDHQHNLVLKIMDEDTFFRDDFVGSATVNMEDVIALGAERGYVELPPTRYRVVLPDRAYYGDIRVSAIFRRKGFFDSLFSWGMWPVKFSGTL